MDRTIQDLAWTCLPKEFKEEVKFEYYRVATKAQKDEYDLGFLHAHEGMFGIHNLTSDAEGEEMLMVSRKKVQELYAKFQHSFDNVVSDNLIGHYTAKMGVLKALFGSKCLPENVATSEPNVDSLHANVDSLEPRFKAGDVAVIASEFKHPLLEQGGAIVTILSYHPNGDFYSCAIAPNVGIDVDAKYLEPYTEPKENITESRKTSQNRDKQFDTILKDGFTKERRLNIAVMMAQAILTRIDDTPQVIADAAFRHADALIAESEKGDTK